MVYRTPRCETMKPLPSRMSIFSFVMAMLIIFAFYPMDVASHGGSEAFKIYHMPEHPGLGDSVGVVFEFHDVSEISSVEIFMCSMEPLICFYADDMNYVGNNTFESIIDYQGRDFKEGTVLGYNFKINYNDNSTEKVPNSSTLEGHENILEVAEDVYYFTITIAGEGGEGNNKDGTDPATIYLVIVLLILVFIVIAVALFLVRAKNKKEQLAEMGDDEGK